MTDVAGLSRSNPCGFLPEYFEGDIRALGEAILAWRRDGKVVRRLRGGKMLNPSDLFNEFSAALQFTPFFGENWDAFFDCLSDPDALTDNRGLVLVILQPDEVLSEGDPREFQLFYQVLQSSANQWATAVADGSAWDRPSLSFQVVLAMGTGSSLENGSRWEVSE